MSRLSRPILFLLLGRLTGRLNLLLIHTGVYGNHFQPYLADLTMNLEPYPKVVSLVSQQWRSVLGPALGRVVEPRNKSGRFSPRAIDSLTEQSIRAASGEGFPQSVVPRKKTTSTILTSW
ncbi:hypothetical protein BJ878DRAFT_483437 [Calycina marina]|uniref:Uncharacterized protein n=1 Tax=Calycina marina TaxID=1763456 RepID=A0A9P7YWE3_9HELO|nr:hypothetical protein BJ878DRAFT_483437 [Calycina marina]